MRYPKVQEQPDTGWSDLILPVMKGYKMACCDCGLVHELDFEVFAITGQTEAGVFTLRPLTDDEAQVAFKARRDNRATGQKRRKRKPD